MAKSADSPASTDRVVELSVNLDDATGETLGDVQQRLLKAGALDVWTTAIGMKKSRPGIMLSVLGRRQDREPLAAMILQATGSFGVRIREWDRVVLDREFVEQETRIGAVTLKVGRLRGRLVSIKPEFEVLRKLAARAGVTMAEARSVAAAAADAYRDADAKRQIEDDNGGGAG